MQEKDNFTYSSDNMKPFKPRPKGKKYGSEMEMNQQINHHEDPYNEEDKFDLFKGQGNNSRLHDWKRGTHNSTSNYNIRKSSHIDPHEIGELQVESEDEGIIR